MFSTCFGSVDLGTLVDPWMLATLVHCTAMVGLPSTSGRSLPHTSPVRRGYLHYGLALNWASLAMFLARLHMHWLLWMRALVL